MLARKIVEYDARSGVSLFLSVGVFRAAIFTFYAITLAILMMIYLFLTLSDNIINGVTVTRFNRVRRSEAYNHDCGNPSPVFPIICIVKMATTFRSSGISVSRNLGRKHEKVTGSTCLGPLVCPHLGVVSRICTGGSSLFLSLSFPLPLFLFLPFSLSSEFQAKGSLILEKS